MKALRIVLILVMIATPSTIDYFSNFQLGREGKPLGFAFVAWTGVALLLFAPFIVGIAAAWIAPVQAKRGRLISGIAAFLATFLLNFFFFPAPAVTYTHGFESAIQTDIGFPKLQHWAQEALVRYHQGALVATNAASYWSAGDVVLLRSDLPSFLTTGLFTAGRDPDDGPEISIRTNRGNWVGGSTGDCIALCWYDHGILVGPPHFTCGWNPYYCKKLEPGIYSYYAGK